MHWIHNKVHVAATELPQLLSHNTNIFGEATAQNRCLTLCSSKDRTRFTASFA